MLNDESHGKRQYVVTRTYRFADAVKMLTGRGVAEFHCQSDASGDVVHSLYAVGYSERIMVTVCIVDDAETNEGHKAPSLINIRLAVTAAEDIPHQVGVIVTVSVANDVCVLEPTILKCNTCADLRCEPLAERHGVCRLQSAKEILTAERLAEKSVRAARDIDKPMSTPWRTDHHLVGVFRLYRLEPFTGIIKV